MAFTQEQCRRLKLLYILETAGKTALRYTLQCGTDGKLYNVPLDEYLKGLPCSSTANYNKIIVKYVKKRLASSDDLDNKMILKHVKEHSVGSDDLDNKMVLKLVKKRSAGSDNLKEMLKEVHSKVMKGLFNHTDQNQISSDPFWGAFDITLLYKSIRVACENVAEMNKDTWKKESSEMEFLVTKIKDLRNELSHGNPAAFSEQEYLAEVIKLKDLFYEALEATKERYNRDDSELSVKKDEVSRAVDVVKEGVGIENIL